MITKSETIGNVVYSADFSDCGKYRYTLSRKWGDGPGVMFIGLNPSTADEMRDDPTIRRCMGFARDWGFSELYMTNLFAFRATDPAVMRAALSPVGLENDAMICRMKKMVDTVIAAWGNLGGYKERNNEIIRLIPNLQCLGHTKANHPRHPLYVPKVTTPIPL